MVGSLLAAAAIADEIQQAGVIGCEPVGLLPAVAAQQRHRDRPVAARHDLPHRARVLPTLKFCDPIVVHRPTIPRMSRRPTITLARVYDDPAPEEGERVLVDRLWPRGMRKNDPRVGRWLPAVAPSTELRRWYSHKRERFDEFATRYAAELESGDGAEALAELRALARKKPVVLVTASRDLDISQAAVLRELLS